MYIVITKDGKPIDAFYKSNDRGYIEIDYRSPMAKLYTMRAEVRA